MMPCFQCNCPTSSDSFEFPSSNIFTVNCGPPPIPEMENYDRANQERWTYSLIVAISSPSSLSKLADLVWWDDFVTAAESDSSVYLHFSE